jgi:intracellular sulfur oxidation DsrE/DsrF family protein
MKRVLFVAGVAVLSLGFANRQAQHPYRVAFDLTSRDSLDQKSVMRWIREVSTASPKVQIEVVMYGKGFELVMPAKSTVVAEVETAMKNPNVSFKVCEIAMKNNQLDKSMFVAGTQTVPDGIRELTEKQQENWGYIKVSH